MELWKSDGTSGGTVLVKDINTGPASSSPGNLTKAGTTLYFTTNDGANGVELWKSDGTEGGTVLVKNIAPGATSSSPKNLTSIGSTLLFAADDGASGVEPWTSDGTDGGTVLIKDVAPGAASSDPALFTGGGSAADVVFVATEAAFGREWWLTDLTSAGIELFFDLNPGSAGSFPQEAVVAPSGDIVFSAEVTASPPVTGFYQVSTVQFKGLEIVKQVEVESTPVRVGDKITYRVTVTNHDSFTRTNLVLTDSISGPARPRWWSQTSNADSIDGSSGVFEGFSAADLFLSTPKAFFIDSLPQGSPLELVTEFRMSTPGTYTNTVTIFGEDIPVSIPVFVDEKNATKIVVATNPPAGTVINLDQITGGTVNGPDGGYPFAHLNGAITIAAAGPFADPFPAGCGWGPAFGLPTFDAVDGVLGMAGLTAHANEITVYPCGAFICVDTNTATLSADPASPDFDTSMAGATIANTTSFVFGGGSGADTLTFGTLDAGPATTTEILGRFLSAGAGDDTLSCTGPGGCALSGDDGNDTLIGGSGGDAFSGGAGDDIANGKGGDDTHVFGPASSAEIDTIIEGATGGSDTLDFSALPATDPVTVNLNNDMPIATHTNRTINTGGPGQAAFFENVTGGAGDDTFTIGFLPVATRTIDGFGGTDTLIVDAGGGGAFNVQGASGSGTITGPGGSITYINVENVILTNVDPAANIPSLSQWALIGMALALAVLLYSRLRRVGTVKA